MQRKPARKKTTSKPHAKRSTTRAKRTTARKRASIAPRGDARYVRRNEAGEFKEVVDVGRSLSNDRRTRSSTVVPSGMGDRGDQKRRKTTRGTRTR